MERRENDLSKKAEEFLRVFKKGEEFTQELLKENERLRYKLLKLEEENNALSQQYSQPQIQQLQERLAEAEEERKRLSDHFRVVEEENKNFATKYVEVEEENNNLANLYVASNQLHSTLDFEEVLRTIIEIMINLVGAERFALMLLDEASGVLSTIASEGMEAKSPKKVRIGEGIIGRAFQSGENFFEEDLSRTETEGEIHPIVCVPLKIKDQTLGVIAVFTLLEQKKKKLTRVDEELFGMLAGHAATAIFSAKLYSQSARKLSTIQGFIDLLSGQDSRGQNG
ncbi:MAG: GAF domain-containing protein [Nitrospirae bacterium]|nr:GAF domain-containing protein [Candidatus Manganitrophaceae bacterium]